MSDLEQRLERVEILLIHLINIVGHDAYIEPVEDTYIPHAHTLEKHIKMIEKKFWGTENDI